MLGFSAILKRLKKNILLIVLIASISVFSQNVTTNANLYTPQQLIEDILIDSDCITNVVVTNFVGGNFNNSDKSYGYFNASGTSFPFNEGLVLSTGKLANVEGPNNTLSDDDASNWNGDNDLETVLNESNTTNATIIEFEFTSVANQISFNYIFASEEYQENNSSTCNYSDLFGFLIRPITSTQYTNIALVPNTNTPVKVTTVHPDIPNGCSAQNEIYFDSWNNSSAPINFNGQTKVLTATASTVPNETYHVKLVIADEQNYRYDSAVFLEAGSFQLSTDLGEDRLLSTNNPICSNDILELEAYNSGIGVTYKWFKNTVEIPFETSSTYTVFENGVYNVEVFLGNNCVSYGEITIEYAEEFHSTQTYLGLCDNDTDGLTFFNLHLAEQFFINPGYPQVPVIGFYLTEGEATQNINPISNPQSFINTVPNQVIFARLENEYGCFVVESLTLTGNYTSTNVKTLETCDDNTDGFTTFNLNELRAQIQPEVSLGAEITFYNTYNDAANHMNQLSDSYINTTPYSQEIYVKAQVIYCELFTTINLIVNESPNLLPNQEVEYCLNKDARTTKINAGLLDETLIDNYMFEWAKEDVDLAINEYEIEVSEGGIYKVKATNVNGCFSERIINVNLSQPAVIEDVIIEEHGDTNSITIITSGIGTYEYAINTNGIFQTDNIFLNVDFGVHTIYVKDINGCETTKLVVNIHPSIPTFFTPNNDSYNDTWMPLLENIGGNSNTKIYIFNRFGKLIKELNPLGNGWDGTRNGIPLPSAGYWYKIILEDGSFFNGHFTLKR